MQPHASPPRTRTTLPLIPKAFAYVTHGQRLLLFRHRDMPEAGVQTPAGSLRARETPVDGALREAREESGLSELIVVAELGSVIRDMSDFGRAEAHLRHFVHLRCVASPPENWIHWETDRADGGAPLAFEFFWAKLPDGLPPLIADHGQLLPQLMTSMERNGVWQKLTPPP